MHTHTHIPALIYAHGSMFALKPKRLHANAEIKRTLSYACSKFSVLRRHTKSTCAQRHAHKQTPIVYIHRYLQGHSGRYEYTHTHTRAHTHSLAAVSTFILSNSSILHFLFLSHLFYVSFSNILLFFFSSSHSAAPKHCKTPHFLS